MTDQHSPAPQSRSAIEDAFPLSPLQEGMLFHSLRDPESAVYVSQYTAELRGTDPDRVHQAWQALVDRHAALRTGFLWEGLDDPVQIVYRDARLPVHVEDWRALPPAEQQRRTAEFTERDRATGFDPRRAPLARLSLLRLAEDTVRLVWSHHGLLLDGWSSAQLMTAEVGGAGRDGAGAAAAPLPAFRDFIDWIRDRDPELQRRHWSRVLGDLTETTPLPLTAARRPTGERGWAAVEAACSREQTERITRAARELRVPLVVLAQGAWGLVLSRHARTEDAVFGMVVSGRSAEVPGIERMIGLLTNTVPVRVRADGSATVGAWLRGLLDEHARTLEHEHDPLSVAMRHSGLPNGQPLFETVLLVQNFQSRGAAPEPSESHFHHTEAYENTHYPLTLFVLPGHELRVRLIYDRAVLAGQEAQDIAERFRRALTGLAADPQARLGAVPVFEPPAEARAAWSTGPVSRGGPHGTLDAALVAAMRAHPDRPAVLDGDRTLSYAELERRSAELAASLAGGGIGPEDKIAILLPRSIESVIATVAVLRAGAAYVPVDPGYPAARIGYVLEDCEPRLIITLSTLAHLARAAAPGSRTRFLDEPAASGAEAPAPPPGRPGPNPDHLAYVIYTSGSTGRPKGVMISHRAILTILDWLTAEFRPRAGRDVVAHKVPVGFTDAVFEVLWPLCNGAAVAVLDEQTVVDPAALWAGLSERGATVSQLVPRQMEAILDTAADPAGERTRTVEWVVNGGEALPTAFAARWRRRFPRTRIANIYGMTESAVYATSHLVPDGQEPDEAQATVSIGRPVDNTSAFVLNRELEQCPTGVIGELLLGGPNLARGYLGQPARTAERFVPNPFGEPGSRLYRTGDLARWCPNGELAYHGRTDFQLKIRGVRVEPGELEAELIRHPAVHDAVATAWDGRLAVYLKPSGGERPDTARIRAWIAERLPAAMVPSFVTWLDELPSSAHGKVDRSALPAPSAGSLTGADSRPPSGPLEELVAGLWRRVLGASEVGALDDFFDLGGDSLLAVRLVAHLRDAVPVDYTVGRLLADRTVSGCASTLEVLLTEVEGLIETLAELELEDEAAAARGGDHG